MNQDNDCLPLTQIKTGQTVRVATIKAGRGLVGRLASMGVTSNARIKVIRNGYPGPFVVEVRETRVVLGKGMADKIMVF